MWPRTSPSGLLLLRSGALLACGALLGCGGKTEVRWSDSSRRVAPRESSRVKPGQATPGTDAAGSGAAPSLPGDTAPGRPGTSNTAPSPSSGPPSGTGLPPDVGPDGPPPGDGPQDGVSPDDGAVPPEDTAPGGTSEPGPPPTDDGGEARPQAICATEPLWTAGEIATETDTTTATSWLVPAQDSSFISWSLMTYPPSRDLFVFGTGDTATPSGTVETGNCESFLPAWSELLGTHAVSADFVSRLYRCPPDSVVPSGALDGGAIALTPDATRIVKVRCAADHTELDVFALGEVNALVVTYSLSGQACPTRMLVTDEFALVADNSPGLRYVALSDGSELFSYPLPGPAGQLDATADASRVLLSTLRGDLIDLVPGGFAADALMLGVPVASLRDEPNQNEVDARLSFVNHGSLVSDPMFAPGYIQLPAALHPAGTLAATFGADEALVVLDTETSDATVLEAGVVSDELLAEEPRTRGLPTAVEFSSDGAFLARVRGGQLAVFACTERPRR
jgi:hypothetical protein